MVAERDVLNERLMEDSYCPGNEPEPTVWPWMGGLVIGMGVMFIAYSK